MKHLYKLAALLTSASIITGCVGSKYSNKEYTLRIAENTNVETLDSTQVYNEASYDAVHMYTDGLYDFDRNGDIKPCLVKNHSSNSNHTKHIFTLKKVKWSNGDFITSDDFIYSWKKALKNHTKTSYLFTSQALGLKGADDIYNASSVSKKLLDNLGIKKIDDFRFEITTNMSMKNLSTLLTAPVFYPINHKFAEKVGNKYGSSPEYVLSNSLFKIKEITKNKAIFTKRDSYKADQQSNITNIEMNFNMSFDKSTQLFDDNKLDYTPIDAINSATHKKKDTFLTQLNRKMVYLIPSAHSKISKKIKEAISLSIDRNTLAKDTLVDTSEPANGMIPDRFSYSISGHSLRTVSGNKLDYSVSKAKELLKDTKKLTITIAYNPNTQDSELIANKLKSDISKIKSLNVHLLKLNNSDINNNQKKYDFIIQNYASHSFDGVDFLMNFQSNNPSNIGKYHNKEYDSAISSLLNTRSNNKRFQYTQNAEDIILNDWGVIPLVEQGNGYLIKTNLKIINRYCFLPKSFKYTTIY